MNTPHKHADLIKKWADGAIIQFNHPLHGWMDVSDNCPSWSRSTEYRVKPIPVVIEGYVKQDNHLTISYFTESIAGIIGSEYWKKATLTIHPDE